MLAVMATGGVSLERVGCLARTGVLLGIGYFHQCFSYRGWIDLRRRTDC